MVRRSFSVGKALVELHRKNDRKVVLLPKKPAIFQKRERIGRLFVKNTQTLFQKSKTDVQAAENRNMKQIDMAQTTKCDKIRVDMHFCVWILFDRQSSNKEL